MDFAHWWSCNRKGLLPMGLDSFRGPLLIGSHGKLGLCLSFYRRATTIGTNVASPADKDGVINHAEQIQLTNMQASEAPSWRRGASLASIFVNRIWEAQLITGLCQLVMRRYVVGRKFTCGGGLDRVFQGWQGCSEGFPEGEALALLCT